MFVVLNGCWLWLVVCLYISFDACVGLVGILVVCYCRLVRRDVYVLWFGLVLVW